MSRSMQFKQNEKLSHGPTLPARLRDQNSCPGTRICGLGTVTLSELSVSGEVLHGKQLITSCLLLQNDDNVPNRSPKTQKLGIMSQVLDCLLSCSETLDTGVDIFHMLMCTDYTNISSQ